MMNETTGRVLELLREGEGFLSGEEIGRRLAISRSAVWKHVRALKESGYRIDAAPKRGYGFRSAVNVPLPAEVTPLLRTREIGRRLEFRDEVDSTNRVLAEIARQGAPAGTVVVADAQTAGRGRMGRRWESPAGENLYVSVLLTPDVAPSRVSQLALVAAVAVHQALAECCPQVVAQIKWPNDILAGGRKVAGILCEASLEADRVNSVILGIGVNVNGGAVPAPLQETATTLRLAGGREVSRPQLLAAVLNHLEDDCGRWLKEGDLAGFLDYFARNSALDGKLVTAEHRTGRVRGTARGIDPGGELLIETAPGEVLRLSAGDVHLLPGEGSHGGPRR